MGADIKTPPPTPGGSSPFTPYPGPTGGGALIYPIEQGELEDLILAYKVAIFISALLSVICIGLLFGILSALLFCLAILGGVALLNMLPKNTAGGTARSVFSPRSTPPQPPATPRNLELSSPFRNTPSRVTNGAVPSPNRLDLNTWRNVVDSSARPTPQGPPTPRALDFGWDSAASSHLSGATNFVVVDRGRGDESEIGPLDTDSLVQSVHYDPNGDVRSVAESFIIGDGSVDGSRVDESFVFVPSPSDSGTGGSK